MIMQTPLQTNNKGALNIYCRLWFEFENSIITYLRVKNLYSVGDNFES